MRVHTHTLYKKHFSLLYHGSFTAQLPSTIGSYYDLAWKLCLGRHPSNYEFHQENTVLQINKVTSEKSQVSYLWPVLGNYPHQKWCQKWDTDKRLSREFSCDFKTRDSIYTERTKQIIMVSKMRFTPIWTLSMISLMKNQPSCQNQRVILTIRDTIATKRINLSKWFRKQKARGLPETFQMTSKPEIHFPEK